VVIGVIERCSRGGAEGAGGSDEAEEGRTEEEGS